MESAHFGKKILKKTRKNAIFLKNLVGHGLYFGKNEVLRHKKHTHFLSRLLKKPHFLLYFALLERVFTFRPYVFGKKWVQKKCKKRAKTGFSIFGHAQNAQKNAG